MESEIVESDCSPGCTCEVCLPRKLSEHVDLLLTKPDASRALDGVLELRAAVRMDDDGHVASLGEWCDCVRCLCHRDTQRVAEAQILDRQRAMRVRDPAAVVDIAEARQRALPDAELPTFLGDFRGQVPQPRNWKAWAVFWGCWLVATVAVVVAVRS